MSSAINHKTRSRSSDSKYREQKRVGFWITRFYAKGKARQK